MGFVFVAAVGFVVAARCERLYLCVCVGVWMCNCVLPVHVSPSLWVLVRDVGYEP